MSASDARFAYKPALDGLRALAVLAVIAYHLDLGWARGGFLGVDAFFVISGYLITSLLVGEWSATGRISRAAFWARRARRLLPALMILLVVVAAYGAAAIPADQLAKLRGDGLATLFYVQNWRLVLSGQSYFDLFSAPSPLRHAWSLAIEEQFYIFWPIIVLVCLKLARGGRRYLVAFCVAGTVASVLLMAGLYRFGDPSRAYYGTDTRAHLLLIGALLALLLERWEPRRAVTTGAVHAGGLVLGVACLLAFARVGDKAAYMYRGGFGVFSVAMTVIIASAVLPGPSPVRAVLSLRALRWIGQISYGLYLWHWPVQVVMMPRRMGFDGVALTGARLGATFAISTLSYYLLELPIRRGVWVRGRISMIVAPAAAIGTALAILVATADAVKPPAVYASPTAATMPELPPPDHPTTASAAPPPTVAATSASGAPQPTATPVPPVRKVALVGDSVADSLASGLEQTLEPSGIRLVRGAIPGCPVANGFSLTRDGAPFSWSENCTKVVPDFQRRLIDEQRPDLVVWLSTWETADRRVDGRQLHFGTSEHDAALLQAMEDTRVRLAAHGARVVMLAVPPRGPTYLGDSPAEAQQFAHLDDVIRRFASEHADTVRVVDLGPIVCPGGFPCPEEVDGLRVRPDGAHFSEESALWVAQRLAPEVLETRS